MCVFARDSRLPWGSKFFHVHAVFGKNLKNNSNVGSWRTPLGKVLNPQLVYVVSVRDHVCVCVNFAYSTPFTLCSSCFYVCVHLWQWVCFLKDQDEHIFVVEICSQMICKIIGQHTHFGIWHSPSGKSWIIHCPNRFTTQN